MKFACLSSLAGRVFTPYTLAGLSVSSRQGARCKYIFHAIRRPGSTGITCNMHTNDTESLQQLGYGPTHSSVTTVVWVCLTSPLGPRCIGGTTSDGYPRLGIAPSIAPVGPVGSGPTPGGLGGVYIDATIPGLVYKTVAGKGF